MTTKCDGYVLQNPKGRSSLIYLFGLTWTGRKAWLHDVRTKAHRLSPNYYFRGWRYRQVRDSDQLIDAEAAARSALLANRPDLALPICRGFRTFTSPTTWLPASMMQLTLGMQVKLHLNEYGKIVSSHSPDGDRFYNSSWR